MTASEFHRRLEDMDPEDNMVWVHCMSLTYYYCMDENDELNYYEELEQIRWWDDMFTCPHCKSDKTPYDVKSRIKNKDIPSYRCSSCDLPFTVRTNTIFHGAKTKISTWYHAAYEIYKSEFLIETVELAKRIGVSQKTAWYMKDVLSEPYLDIFEKKEPIGCSKSKILNQ